jgi:C4-type Zn-finger protein
MRLVTDNIRLCPFCKKGEVRKHRRVAEGQTNKPFWQKVENNDLICDTCGHVIHDNELTERTSTAAKPKTIGRLCSSCNNMKAIVFELWGFRICKECLENVREERNLDKSI